MPRSGWAAHGNRPKKVAKLRSFTQALGGVAGAFFERTGIPPAQWQELANGIVGRLVLPGMPDYDDDRASNPRFNEYPQGIVYCAVPNDVRLALELARAHREVSVTCRSGGHSTAGYSVNNGMVIDLSLMSYASVDKDKMTVTTGAGTSFEVFDSVLNTYALHVPSGGCPDVCVGGYMQGGGYGFTTRQFGINCDRVVAFEMVLADGRVVTADEKNHAPLFWGVRGGTGNQFGVLTNVTYALSSLKYVTGLVAMWSLEKDSAPRVLSELQSSFMQSGAPREFGYQVMITNPDPSKHAQPVLILLAMYPGSEEDVRRIIAPLLAVATPLTDPQYIRGTYDVLNATMVDNVLPGPGTPGTLELKCSGYIAKPVGTDGWEEICSYMLGSPNPYNMAYLEIYGGAVNDAPQNHNAFIHRNVDCDFVIDSFYNPAWKGQYDGSVTEEQAQQWMDGLWARARPHTNGHVYQDYPDRTLSDYRWQYWGDAFPTLLAVKQAYDPTQLFHYGQPISPYPEGENITRSTARPLFELSKP